MHVANLSVVLLLQLAVSCAATLRILDLQERRWCSCSHISEVLGASSHGGLVVVAQTSRTFGDVSCLHAEWSLLLGKTRGLPGKAAAYVVFLGQGDQGNLEPLLESLGTEGHWNSRARFVACHQGAAPAVDALVRRKVHNAVLLDCRGPRGLLVPRLYADVSSCRLVTWSYVQSRRGLETSVLFPNEHLRDLRGCQVLVSVLEEPPYVVLTPEGAFEGLDVETARTALQWLHAEPLFAAGDPRYGVGWLENETWNGMLGDVVNDRFDLAASGFILVPERLGVVDAVYPHLRDGAVWVVPRARPLPPWRSLLRTFGGDVWLVCGVAVVATTLLLCLLEGWYRGVTGLCSSSLPRALTLAVLGAVLMTSLFSSVLLATLLEPGRETQVTTLDAARAAGLRFAYERVMDYFLQEDPEVLGLRDLGTTSQELFAWVARRSHGILSVRLVAHYFQNHLLRDQIFTFPDVFFSFDTCMYLGKDHALLEPLNVAVMRMNAAGLLPKWERDLARKAWLRTSASAAPRARLFVIGVRHLLGAFVLLGVGVAVASVALLFEICVARSL